jgi:hypothetical protein
MVSHEAESRSLPDCRSIVPAAVGNWSGRARKSSTLQPGSGNLRRLRIRRAGRSHRIVSDRDRTRWEPKSADVLAWPYVFLCHDRAAVPTSTHSFCRYFDLSRPTGACHSRIASVVESEAGRVDTSASPLSSGWGSGCWGLTAKAAPATSSRWYVFVLQGRRAFRCHAPRI